MFCVLRIGISVNGHTKPINSCHNIADPKPHILADRRHKYPDVYKGQGKLNNYSLKLHMDDSVRHIAQPVRRIAFSRRQKVCDKLEALVKLGVIEKVSGQTSSVNPLVAVEKQNGDVRRPTKRSSGRDTQCLQLKKSSKKFPGHVCSQS